MITICEDSRTEIRPVFRFFAGIGAGRQSQVAGREQQTAPRVAVAEIGEAAAHRQAPIQRLAADAGRDEPAVDQELRRRNDQVGIRRLGIDPAPQGIDVGRSPPIAEQRARRGDNGNSGGAGQGQERAPGHRPRVERQEGDVQAADKRLTGVGVIGRPFRARVP